MVDHEPEVYYDHITSESINDSEKEAIHPQISAWVCWPKERSVIIALLAMLKVVVIVVASIVGTMKAKRSSKTSPFP